MISPIDQLKKRLEHVNNCPDPRERQHGYRVVALDAIRCADAYRHLAVNFGGYDSNGMQIATPDETDSEAERLLSGEARQILRGGE